MVKDDKGNIVWKPTIKQEKFLSVPLSVKEAFYAGAVNAGKSDVLLMYPIVHGWHEHAMFKGLFLRRTMPELRNEIIPRAKSYFKHFGATYNKTDGLFTFPSGALYFMGHCEHEDDVHNYDSMQPNYVGFDELTSFTEWIYLYITIERIRVAEAWKHELPMIARSGSNPGNIGHQFVYKRFIKPAPEGGKLLIGRGGIKRVFIPATIDDNPHASEQYKKELDALPDAERKAKKYGDWSAYEGQVFDEFRIKKYPGEPDNALHVIEPFDVPIWWPKIVAMDWGYAPPAMTWAGFGAISPEGKVYLYRELAWQKTKIEEWCAELKPLLDHDNPRVVKLCKSAGQDRGQEHTIIQQVESALGRSVQLTSNQPGSRIAGKMLLHEYFRWKPKHVPLNLISKPYDHEYAEWLLRNRTLKEYQSYLDSFKQQEPETNLPKFQCFNTCELFISAINSCIYDKTNPQDVAEFPGDDPYDGIRYLVDAADKYFEDAQSDFDKIKRRELLTQNLERTKDMTAFYRNARQLDNEATDYIKPVRRYH